MRKLEPEHDPLIDNITNLKATDVGESTADTQIPHDEEISDRGRNVDVSKSGEGRKHSRNSADNLEKPRRNVDISKSGESRNSADSKPRRSDRLKRRHLVKKVSCSTTAQQENTSVKEMGDSCSSELEELKKENKLLKNRCMKTA